MGAPQWVGWGSASQHHPAPTQHPPPPPTQPLAPRELALLSPSHRPWRAGSSPTAAESGGPPPPSAGPAGRGGGGRSSGAQHVSRCAAAELVHSAGAVMGCCCSRSTPATSSCCCQPLAPSPLPIQQTQGGHMPTARQAPLLVTRPASRAPTTPAAGRPSLPPPPPAPATARRPARPGATASQCGRGASLSYGTAMSGGNRGRGASLGLGATGCGVEIEGVAQSWSGGCAPPSSCPAHIMRR